MAFSTPRAAVAAALFALPLAASAQPAPPPPGGPVGVVTVDGTLADSPYTLLATDGGRAALGFGPDNQLNALYAHVDPAAGRLNIGIAGITERNDNVGARNSVVVFLDTKAGGFTSFDYDRSNGPDFGNGVTNLNSGSAFDVGFTADYALQVGCDAAQCYANLYTLRTAAAGGGSNLFIGNSTDPDFAVSRPATAQDSRTQGFEVSLSYSTDGTGADLALDRHSVQMFALITSASGFVSDQFLTPADAAAGNYGNGAADFEQSAPGPVSLVWQTVAGRHGWRHLAWPVAGGTVANYAAQNFVQGPGTAFPTGNANVILGYSGSQYVEATALADPLASGRGQLWYHYDAADFPGGAVPPGSNFQPLPYTLVAGGVEPQGDVQTFFSEITPAGIFVMAGNPFALDFDLAGIESSSSSALPGPLAYVWDPDMGAAGGYVTIDRNAPSQADRTVAPMQGFWVETVNSARDGGQGETHSAAGGISFTYPQVSRVQGNEPLVARTVAQRVLAFSLDRLTGTGFVPEWHSARLALVDGAGEEVDAFDGGLPPAIGSTGARIGFVSTGSNGQPVYRGQESRAYDVAAPVVARLALSAPAAATYRLTWPRVEDLPAEWTMTLSDGDTGETVDLRTVGHYDFGAAAGDWTSRFTVRVERRTTAAEVAPGVARLGAPFPNPASGETRLALSVDQTQRVRAELFDALGRRVALVLDAIVDAPRDLKLNTQGLAPGVYVLRVSGNTFAESRRITVSN